MGNSSHILIYNFILLKRTKTIDNNAKMTIANGLAVGYKANGLEDETDSLITVSLLSVSLLSVSLEIILTTAVALLLSLFGS